MDPSLSDLTGDQITVDPSLSDLTADQLAVVPSLFDVHDLTADQIAVDPSLSDLTADPPEPQSHSEWLLGTAVVVFGVVWLIPDALLIKVAHSSGTCILFYRMLHSFSSGLQSSVCCVGL